MFFNIENKINYNVVFIYLVFLICIQNSLAKNEACYRKFPTESFYFYSQNFRDLHSTCNEFFLYNVIEFISGSLLIRRLPDFFFANMCITSLRIDNIGLEIISHSQFAEIAYLSEIYINQNQIVSFDELISSLNTKFLKKIDLSKNQMKKLSAKFPPNYVNLTELCLDYNYIESIPDFVFENLLTLKILSIQYNRLKSIGKFQFSGLKKLENLLITGNFISQIEPSSFNTLEKLISLDLKENTLQYINNTFYGLEKLQELKISSNQITMIEVNTFTALRFLSLLEISNNPLGESFNFTNLETCNNVIANYVRLGRITIKTLARLISVNTLSFYQSRIESIEDDAFTNLKKLTLLDLKYNKLTTITNKTFSGLINLGKLNLEYNLISTIEPLAFAELVNLKYIFLTKNLIKTIPCDLFKNIKWITFIDLSFNMISVIRTKTFTHLFYLTEINFESNFIEKFEHDSFRNLSNLQKINFSINKFREIKMFYFKGISKVSNMILNGNGINLIQKGSFQNMKYSVKMLDLSENFIYLIEPSAFMNISFNFVDLSKNQLSELNSNMFVKVSINSINLEQNQVESLEDASLSSLSLTVNFYFGKNKIKFISNRLFLGEISKAEVIYLNNNFLSNLTFLSTNQFESLKELDISFNLIEYVFLKDLNGLKTLKKLNVANNRLKYIDQDILSSIFLNSINLTNISCWIGNNFSQQLDTLDLSWNRLDNFSFIETYQNLNHLFLRNSLNGLESSFNFSLLPNLKTLDLSDNFIESEKIININQAKDLRKLYLSNMRIESIDQFNLSQIRNLVYLNLSFNGIKLIHIQFKFVHLEILDLSDNQIEFFEENAFSLLFGLHYLNLENNRLKIFQIDSFNLLDKFIFRNNIILKEVKVKKVDAGSSVMFYVKEIDFSGNSIEEIRLDSIIKIDDSLERLLLNENKIRQIDRYFFITLNKLKYLSLYSNEISLIDASVFSSQDQLEYINLANNFIKSLDERTFSNLYHLKYLNLASNQLEFINSSLFSQLFNLNYLDLSFNRLSLIDNFSFKSLSNLQSLRIDDNSIDFQLMPKSLDGLSSIFNLYVSFSLLKNNSNKNILSQSLHAHLDKTVGELKYFKSINIMYKYDPLDDDIDCILVLDFLRINIQVNLNTDSDFLYFLSHCLLIDIFPI